MTPRERQIMDLIKKNPRMSQSEIAKCLEIKRSSVAAHIANLTSKGYILGRGYLFREDPYVVVIGGANMDIRGIPKGQLKMKDSNPGFVQSSPGGVGRNISENLARLKNRVYMMCMLGDDQWGRSIIEEGQKVGLSYEKSYILPGRQTPVYLEILDEKKDMLTAINDMALVDELDPDRVMNHRSFIENASYLVLDTNLPEETLQYLLKNIPQKYIVDGVSSIKVEKIRDKLSHIHLLKVNEYEAAVLAGRDLNEAKDYLEAGKILLDQGLEYLVITCGKEGAWGFHKGESLHLKGKDLVVKNATGAGDAFTAALAHALGEEKSLKESLYFAMGASRLALKSEKTNADELTVEKIEKEMKEVFVC